MSAERRGALPVLIVAPTLPISNTFHFNILICNIEELSEKLSIFHSLKCIYLYTCMCFFYLSVKNETWAYSKEVKTFKNNHTCSGRPVSIPGYMSGLWAQFPVRECRKPPINDYSHHWCFYIFLSCNLPLWNHKKNILKNNHSWT